MADAKPSAANCDRLVRLVPPPAAPVDAHGDWITVETVIGTRLPKDYKRLVEAYGWGEFCDFLYLRTPFGTNKRNGIQWQIPRPTGSPEGDPERYPYPLHPAPGGLLIWGTTMDADRLCWLTDGVPEQWPVVVWSSEGWYETHRMGAAEFLESWAGGRVSSGLLGSMEPNLAPWFNAFRTRTHPVPAAVRRPLVPPRSATDPARDAGSHHGPGLVALRARRGETRPLRDGRCRLAADLRRVLASPDPNQLPTRGQQTGSPASRRRCSAHGM